MSKVLFINGVTGGIGASVAERLAKPGAKLVVSGRDAGKLAAVADSLKGKGADVLAVTCDVTSEESVAAAFEQARAKFGGVDVLVNVPGLSVPAKLAEMNVEDFDRTFDVNVRGMFLCAKHFVRRVDPARGGLLISISSVAALTANPNAPAYCAAKAAVSMLAEGLALQTKAANVRVTTLSPGAVTTPGFWGTRPVPHEKFLKPADVASVVQFVIDLPASVVVHDLVFESFDFFRSK
jgi:NAD(P)-dependent dehydrogenase (short-subunit alcohol dehydrogenase family)